MKRKRGAGTNSSAHDLERDSDPEFKSYVKIFRQAGFVGKLKYFSWGPKHTLSDLDTGQQQLNMGFLSKSFWGL